MKTFKQLSEERGEKAFKQAIAMGLKYGGFGYWKDPQTNETVYKTENDTLVKVEPREESELAAKGGPDAGGGRPDGMGGAGMPGGGGMAGAGGILNMRGGGNPMAGMGIQGAPMPGQEQAPKEDGWEPGPDGDTCVGPEGLPPGKIPQDSFVGRTNFLKWKAGPDGSNITNVSLGEIKEQIAEAEDDTRRSVDAQGIRRQLIGKEPVKSRQRGLGTRTMQQGANAAYRLEQDHPTIFQKQLNAMNRIVGRQPMGDTRRGKESESHVEAGRKADMGRKAMKMPAILKDADLVKAMNDRSREFVKDADYDMTQFHEDMDGPDFIGGGAFGAAYEDNNGNIVKQGGIGPDELAALYAMRDNPRFPTLINAEFEEPFKHQSSYVNNPLGADNDRKPEGESRYWNPDEGKTWDDMYPTAQGRYAMTQSPGAELASIYEGLDEEDQQEIMRNFWRARGDLHKAGFSHNDMHGGNILVNPDTNEVNIIDLGLAKQNRLSALMEALGGLDFEEGNDYMLTRHMGGSAFSDRMRDMSLGNRAKVEEALLEKFENMDDEDAMMDYMQNVQDMLHGDIRMFEKDFDRLREDIPALQDEEFIGELINTLYNEIGNSELADRMSDAFDRRQDDSKIIRAANRIRAGRGEKPIKVTNPNVVPPRNLIFDHDD